MHALQFRHDVLRYLVSRSASAISPRLWSVRLAPLHEVRLPWPETAHRHWIPVRVRLAGICGTDINLLTGRDSLFLEPEASYPFVPGHEIVGEIEPNGARVAVWSVLGCRTRNVNPPCAPCGQGWDGQCERRADTWPGAGLGIGFNRETGGGWAQAFLAHRSQLWPLTDAVSDADAVLLDPAATALAALLRSDGNPEQTLVIGGGTIGLLVAHLHNALGFPGSCELLVKHEFQKAWAQQRGYSATLIRSEPEFRDWASSRGYPAHRVAGYGWVFRGVFDRVIDAAGSLQSVRWGLASTRPGGCLCSVTAPRTLDGVDPTALWYRDITWRGVYVYGPVRWEDEWLHPFSVLLPRLESKQLVLRDLLTHTFGLSDYDKAFDAAVHRRESRAIKVAMDPRAPAS